MRAYLLCLALFGCASANMRETTAHGDLDRDGCIAYRCKAYCRPDATTEQVAAFRSGAIDAMEREQLDRLKFWVIGDTATTITAMTLCESAHELNPILGPNPNPVTVIAYSGIAYAYAYHAAKRTPEWCSSARPIKTAANLRAAATITNAVTIGVCR